MSTASNRQVALLPLEIAPGMNREGTVYSNKGGWYYVDKMRFRGKLPEKIGGWQKYLNTPLLGVARSIMVTADLTGIKADAIGTNLKYYIVRGGSLIDVTPIRRSVTLGANPFASTNGSFIITVTDVGSGAAVDDFVTFSGATGFAGISAGALNDEHQIVSIVDADHYTILIGESANTATTGGGGAVEAEYQLHVGLASQVSGPGWGAGVWGGSQGWGEAADVFVPGNSMRLWSQCPYGEDVIFCPRGGEMYLWDVTTPNDRGVALSSLPGADEVPETVTEVFIADISRQVFAFGCNPIGSSDMDPMLIRFAAFENAVKWNPDTDNEAGDLRLSVGSKIVTAIQTKGEIVVFTDAALYSLQYREYPLYWGASLISTGQSIVGPNAKTTVNQTIFWMGAQNFYVYDGHVKILPCSINDYVFSNLDETQTDKVFCGVNSGFGEIWWFYPAVGGTGECDSYVIYDYEEGLWSYGSLNRTVWADKGIEPYPVAVSDDGYFYNQEFGCDDGSFDPPSPITAYIQSSQLELDPGGNNFAFANRVIPDVTFRPGNTTSATPSVDFIFIPQDYPGAPTKTPSDSPVTASTVTVNVQEFTQQAWIRLRGRSIMMKVISEELGVAFRLGTTRLEVRPDGRR